MSISPEKDLARILSRCEIADCWHWLGAAANTGYGKAGAGSLRNNTRRVVNVHRFVYEQLVGVPPGMILDHLCRNKTCVNPDHLEPVTKSINALRGFSPQRERTHCKNEHEYLPGSFKIRKTGGRWCYPCSHESYRRGRAKLQAAQQSV